MSNSLPTSGPGSAIECVADWTAWSACDRTCFDNEAPPPHQARTFLVSVSADIADCPLANETVEVRYCHAPFACPTDCTGGWTSWSTCLATCDDGYEETGTQMRTFKVDRAAANGGLPCLVSVDDVEVQLCAPSLSDPCIDGRLGGPTLAPVGGASTTVTASVSATIVCVVAAVVVGLVVMYRQRWQRKREQRESRSSAGTVEEEQQQEQEQEQEQEDARDGDGNSDNNGDGSAASGRSFPLHRRTSSNARLIANFQRRRQVTDRSPPLVG